jgi:hypothetical protein
MWSREDYDRVIMLECGDERPQYLTAFWTYHDTNPDVYKAYMRVAGDWQREGRLSFSISELTEHLRRHVHLRTADEQGLKLRNVLRAYYARLLIFVRPSLGHCIVINELEVPRKRHQTEPVSYNHGKEKGKRKRLAQLWMTHGRPEENGRGGKR